MQPHALHHHSGCSCISLENTQETISFCPSAQSPSAFGSSLCVSVLAAVESGSTARRVPPALQEPSLAAVRSFWRPGLRLQKLPAVLSCSLQSHHFWASAGIQLCLLLPQICTKQQLPSSSSSSLCWLSLLQTAPPASCRSRLHTVPKLLT